MADGVKVALIEDGTLLELVLDIPKGNVLSGEVMRALDAALAEHASRADLKLVTIRGAGKHFSFGASVEEHRKDQAQGMLESFHALARRIGGYPVPVAALVEGRCLGGAFEVALVCHFVLATPRAVFACPEIKLGVFPPVLAALGPSRLGPPTAERLLLTGGDLDAATAKAIGFVSEITESDLEAFGREWFKQHLAPLSAYSLRQAVAAVRRQTVAQLGDALDAAEQLYLQKLLPSHDGNEGIEAFLAKRDPKWTSS